MPLKISRILHAGYVFECDETQIAFDPILENPFSRNCHAFPNVNFDHEEIRKLKLAAVFISHHHDDHCSLESLNLLDRNTPIYLYCHFEELFVWIKELGFKNVHHLAIDLPVHVGSFEIIPRRALDADVDSMFQIKADGFNVLNVVDSWIDYSTLDLLVRNGPWDMVLWPFQTMREIEVLSPSRTTEIIRELPPEWIEQLKKLNPKYVVPSSCQFQLESWSWYNQAFFPVSYRQFQKEIETALRNSRVVRMNPSVSVVLDGNSLKTSSPLKWIQPIGEQDVDYEISDDQQPQTTAEISRHFAPLTSEQTEIVFNFCRSGLLEKYRLLGPPEDTGIDEQRHWRLSVFDHAGVPTNFYYRIHGAKIDLVPEGPDSFSTEVPISRLYGALEAGESLTSMYVRINDAVFDEAIDDPLIRCLFNGAFGAYQAAQLKRLRNI